MKLEHLAANKLFVHFAGKPLHYIDHITRELIACQVFLACLPFSDYSFAIAVPSQRIVDFLYALECCLQYIGGTPQILGPDNLKSAIIRADRYEPDVNRSLEDFANHYNITVIPTRPRKPRDKALVENQVKLIYNRVYARLRNSSSFLWMHSTRLLREK
jgi:transposase